MAMISQERSSCWSPKASVAQDVLDHDDRAVDDHAEIERAQREQVRGNVAQIEQNRGEQQARTES